MKSLLLLFLPIVLLVTGCGPAKKPVPEVAPDRYPFDIATEVDDGMMIVSWKTAGEGLISGYNIYISEEPLLDDSDSLPPNAEPFNTTTFAGDTDPDDGIEHYEARGLENGVLYFVHVRIVYPDRTLSVPTEEVRAVCGPRGDIELAIRYQGEPDGFSFAQDGYVDADAVANDLYYYYRDGSDYLVAPAELGGFLRPTRFLVLDIKGDLDQVAEKLALLTTEPPEDRVRISHGDWVWILTADKRHALVRVDGFAGTGEGRRLQLHYAYTPRSGAPVF